MFAAYKASVAMLRELNETLGPAHQLVASASASETVHLAKVFTHEGADRADATALMQHLRTCDGDVFSESQKASLLEITLARMHASIEETTVLSKRMHGSQKLQTHMHSFNYYSEAGWCYFSSCDHTMRRKFNFMS